MRIVGVNGIHSDGSTTTDLILARLEEAGYETYDVNQSRRWAITAWWNADNDAEAIVDALNDGDVVVAHSYGCLKALHAARYVDFRAMFLFAPAVERSWDFSRARTKPEAVHAIYGPRDSAIALGDKIPFHPFGNAGRKGFLDRRVHNMPVEEIGKNHGGFFQGDQLTQWVAYIQRTCA